MNFSFPASWSDPHWDRIIASDQGQELILRAGRYFAARREEGAQNFVFKDPRTSSLLPFWEAVFQIERLKPVFIVAVRDPRAVAASIGKFAGQSEEMADLLWMESMTTIMAHLSTHPFALALYETWFEDPARQIEGLSQSVFGVTASPETVDSIVATIIKSPLNHSGRLAPSNNPAFSERYYQTLRVLPVHNTGAPDGEMFQAGRFYADTINSLGRKLHPDKLAEMQDFDRRERAWARRIEDLEEALVFKDRAVARRAARPAEYYLNMGRRLLDRGGHDLATRALVIAHALSPTLVEPPFFASISVYHQGDKEAALAWARTAASLVRPGSGHWAPQDRVAQILIQLGRLQEADEVYRDAIADSPRTANLYRNRAALCELRGQDHMVVDLLAVAEQLERPLH